MAMHMKKMVLLANNFSYDGEILAFKHFKQRLLIKPHTSLPCRFHFNWTSMLVTHYLENIDYFYGNFNSNLFVSIQLHWPWKKEKTTSPFSYKKDIFIHSTGIHLYAQFCQSAFYASTGCGFDFFQQSWIHPFAGACAASKKQNGCCWVQAPVNSTLYLYWIKCAIVLLLVAK